MTYTLTNATTTWTAVIEYDNGETMLAEQSRWDTLRETTTAAIAEASGYLREGLAGCARIHLHKTTKARGTEYDRQAAYIYTEGDAVFVDRWS